MTSTIRPYLEIDDVSLALLQKIGEHVLKRKLVVMWARPMRRFGYSGSSLYVARFASVGRGPNSWKALQPWAIKIGDPKKIRDEVDSHMVAKERFGGESTDAIVYGGMAGFATKFHENAEGDVTELRDILFRPMTSRRRGGWCHVRPCDILDSVYGSLKARFHNDSRFENRSWGKLYSLSDSDIRRVTARVDWMLSDRDASCAESLTSTYRQLSGETTSVLLGWVHGDLHTSNVILSQPRGSLDAKIPSAQLIDFSECCDYGHILKDFVLMECSVRFHRFPRDINYQTHRLVDKMLLDEHGTNKVRQFVESLQHKNEYHELCDMIDCIRSNARLIVESKALDCGITRSAHFFDEYRKALFLILFWLLKFDSYTHSAAAAILDLSEAIDGRRRVD